MSWDDNKILGEFLEIVDIGDKIDFLLPRTDMGLIPWVRCASGNVCFGLLVIIVVAVIQENLS